MVCRCSSKDTIRNDNFQGQSQIPKSHAADASRQSFLGLPGELRNAVYCQALIFDNALRRMPRGTTKVPTLVLLRVCKQIHDEAASVFYGGNSFYYFIEHTAVPPRVGAMFPSARYQRWLTRVTIRVHMWKYKPQNVTFHFCGEGGSREMVRTSDEVVELFHTFDEMKTLWREKEGQWEGALVVEQEPGGATGTIWFFMSEEEERRTKQLWAR
jgi:hypothetical protein